MNPDPSGNFNAAAFRTNIRAAMKMGLSNTAGDAPIFRWIVKDTYTVSDPSARPYNWFQNPAPNSPAPIADLSGVDCALQYGGDSTEGTEAGLINEQQVKVILLDVDQQTLLAHGGRMPDQVLLKGEIYNVDYVPAPQGLFDVDVWTIYCTAQSVA